jgi:hypothetical protein
MARPASKATVVRFPQYCGAQSGGTSSWTWGQGPCGNGGAIALSQQRSKSNNVIPKANAAKFRSGGQTPKNSLAALQKESLRKTVVFEN